MSLRTGQVTDDYGRPVPGAKVYVTAPDGGEAVLTADEIDPLAQPVIANEFGIYSYHAPDGFYTENIWYGGKLRFAQIIPIGDAYTNILTLWGAMLGVQAATALSEQGAASERDQAALSAMSASIAAGASSTALAAVLTAIAGAGGSISGTIAIQASTRAILQATHLPTGGLSAYVSEPGFEGSFVFDSSNLVAKVTGDPGQGIYLPPVSASGLATNGSQGAWVRRPGIDTWYKASWWGQKADGAWNGATYTGTDDTVSIQRAIDWVYANGGGTIIFKAGYSVIGGALQDTSYSNAQILLPNSTSVTEGRSIRLMGETLPAAVAGETGAILCSTLASGTGNLIGRRNNTGVSRIAVAVENLTLRLPQNSGNTALDCYEIPFVTLHNVRIDVAGGIGGSAGAGALYVTAAQPTHITNYGFIAPGANVALACVIENVYVFGYYSAALLGELVSGDNFYVSACVYGVSFMMGPHPLRFGRILITNSIHCARYVDLGIGGLGLQVEIDQLDYEKDTVAGSGPSWVESAATRYDIDDAASQLRGLVKFVCFETSSMTMNGALALRIERVNKSFNPFPLFGGFGTNPASHVQENTYKYLQYPMYRVDHANISLAGLEIGGHFLSNHNNPGPDFRMAGWYARTAGDSASADYYLGTANAGVWHDRLVLDHLGNFLFKSSDVHLYGTGNDDLSGVLTISGATSGAKAFNRTYLSVPAVIVTPQFNLGTTTFWVTPTATGFTITTSAAVTGSFAYHVLGNG